LGVEGAGVAGARSAVAGHAALRSVGARGARQGPADADASTVGVGGTARPPLGAAAAAGLAAFGVVGALLAGEPAPPFRRPAHIRSRGRNWCRGWLRRRRPYRTARRWNTSSRASDLRRRCPPGLRERCR
jgi:hypothetical protein